MVERKQIKSINVGLLVEHPGNPNRMNDASFGKLVAHIKRSGNYEPIVVRPHQNRVNCVEIINGHHRVKALKELGVCDADCVVWEINDNEALVLLSTLNQLSGSDDVFKKSAIIKTLSESFSTKELAKILPDSAKSIEKLKDLSSRSILAQDNSIAFLNPVTFFLNDEQREIVNTAVTAAIDHDSGRSSATRAAEAIVKIAIHFYPEKQ